jgi:hypothetical protein
MSDNTAPVQPKLEQRIREACRKCGAPMQPGVAFAQTYSGSGDFGRDDVVTMSPGGPGRLIECLKCSGCGWSVTSGVRSPLDAIAE